MLSNLKIKLLFTFPSKYFPKNFICNIMSRHWRAWSAGLRLWRLTGIKYFEEDWAGFCRFEIVWVRIKVFVSEEPSWYNLKDTKPPRVWICLKTDFELEVQNQTNLFSFISPALLRPRIHIMQYAYQLLQQVLTFHPLFD